MKIGQLNRRVDLLKFVSWRDEYEPVSGTEFFQSQTVNAETVIKITVRYNPRINVMHRIGYLGKVYEIIGKVDEDTGHFATILNCKEIVNRELQCQNEEGQGGGGGCIRSCP